MIYLSVGFFGWRSFLTSAHDWEAWVSQDYRLMHHFCWPNRIGTACQLITTCYLLYKQNATWLSFSAMDRWVFGFMFALFLNTYVIKKKKQCKNVQAIWLVAARLLLYQSLLRRQWSRRSFCAWEFLLLILTFGHKLLAVMEKNKVPDMLEMRIRGSVAGLRVLWIDRSHWLTVFNP